VIRHAEEKQMPGHSRPDQARPGDAVPRESCDVRRRKKDIKEYQVGEAQGGKNEDRLLTPENVPEEIKAGRTF